MDVISGDAPDQPGEPLRPAQALARLRAVFNQRLKELEASISVWGVRLDHPEGKFIRAQIESQQALAEMVFFQAQHCFKVQDELQMVEHHLRATVINVDNAMKVRVSTMETDVKRMITEMISSFGKRLADETSRWRYIREKKWNLRQNLIGVLGLTVLAACLVIGGYYWRYAQDTDAIVGLWTCENGGMLVANPRQEPDLVCPLNEFVNPGTYRAMENKFLPAKP